MSYLRCPVDRFFFIVILFLLLNILFCADRAGHTNPVDAGYVGDYRFGVGITPQHDSMVVFYNYEVECFDSGADKFSSYSLSTDPPGKVLPVYRKPSPFPLYFTSPFTGRLIVTGIRPNEKTVEYSCSVSVINPYRIVVDSVSLYSGSVVRFRMENRREVTQSDTLLYVRWRRESGGGSSVKLRYDSVYSVVVSRPDSFYVSAVLVDGYGSELELSSLGVNVPAFRGPEVTISESLVVCSVGRPCTIVGVLRDGDSVGWWIKGIGKDTVTVDPQMTVVWPDSMRDTIIVVGRGRYGVVGGSDTVYIDVRRTSFDLELVKFPAEVRARRKGEWEVRALRDGKEIEEGEVRYEWIIEPEGIADSIEEDGGRLEVYFRDDPGQSVRIGVYAVSGLDSSYMRSVEVRVIADKPVVEVIKSDTLVNLGDTAKILISSRDTNRKGDGRVVGVYYRVNGGEVSEVKGDTLGYLCMEPGLQGIELWCVDDDGFESGKAVVNVHVTSRRPYFLRSRVDTTVYVGDSVRISAPAECGNVGCSIVEWLWDIGMDGAIDFTTTRGYFDTVFTDAGVISIRVGCKDGRGDSAETLAVYGITVSKGAPVVTVMSVSPRSVYRGDSVRVRIVASDPNGRVDSLYIGIDSVMVT